MGLRRLSCQSRLYLILADFEGNLVAPRAVKEFGTVAQICKRGPSCGDSIFIGFATQWEAQLACDEAGIDWPGI